MYRLLNCLLLLIFALLLPTLTLAQEFNVASTYQQIEDGVSNGDILVTAGANGFKRTDISYDNKIFGVFQEIPLIVVREASSSAKPILRSGDTTVKVSDFNGAIKKGDLITSSPVLGYGMKATDSGYVLGVALSDANLTGNATALGKNVKTGEVSIALRIEFAEISTPRNTNRLLEAINSALFKVVQDPEKFPVFTRYLIAALIAIICFTIGFFAVSRSISNAVISIGRNPLARRSILFSVALQLVLVAIAAVVMIVVIYIIVRL